MLLEFLGDTKVGYRSSGMARGERGEAKSVRWESEGEEGGPALGCVSFLLFP